MPIIPSLLNWINIKRSAQFELFKKYPLDVQQEVLFKNIQKAKHTEWGVAHGFHSIKSIEDYQRQVPISTYEDTKGHIDRMLNGENDILWPDTIKWFAKSSGTTADKSKFIPVSKEALEDNHFRGGRDVYAIYAGSYPNTNVFSGKGLTLGGSHQINEYNNNALYGDLSAILIENVPFWTYFSRTPSSKIALLDKWEIKLNEITKATVKDNVTSIMGVPSWNLILLKHVLDYTGKSNILEVWPNLELFIHGGVNFSPYREQFKKIIPSDTMHYMETYNASEGFFAIQDSPERDDMMLILDIGIFYEFIPMEDIEKENPRALTIDEVKVGENYAIVISTNSGLWRYLIGDTVIITSTYPHRIKISGRTKHFINAFGEEVIIDNAEKALSMACKKTGAIVNEYTAAPVYMGDNIKGSHEWLIEFSIPPKDIQYFATVLDNSLKSINSDYEAKRYNNITLDMPIIHSLKEGTFYRWLESKGKLGGQNKVPRLYNTRKYVDELLKFL